MLTAAQPPFPASDRAPTWSAREVVRELDDRPHLLLRVTVHGGPFPHRALPPFVRIGGENGVESWFAEVAPDGSAVHGYFPVDPPEAGAVEVGYGPQVVARAEEPFAVKAADRLDRDRLDADDVVVVTQALLRKRQAGAR